MLRFNTAIFYDVENLTQGNNFSKDFIEILSLKSIYKQITDLAWIMWLCNEPMRTGVIHA